MSTSLLCSQAYLITHAKTHVLSDSVLCVGKVGNDPVESWKTQIQWYSENHYFQEMDQIDGIFQGFTMLVLLEQIQKLMEDLKCESEHFKRQDHLHVHK